MESYMGRHKPPRTNHKGSAAINRKNATEYLKKNGNRPEVTTKGSGLQYEIVEQGDGGFVEYNSILTVNHRITLLDGTVIEDTYKSGSPETFLLKEVIKGYHEGLLLMSVGDRCKFAIPPELGWNKRGSNEVPPFALILIDCTVLSQESVGKYRK